MASTTTTDSSETHLPFPVHRWTVEQFHALTSAGLLDDDDRVELLEGVIVPKMNASPRHSATVQAVHEALRAVLPAGWSLRIQDVLTTDDSQPEPDVAVVSGTHRDYCQSHPTAAQTTLVVEVADSSFARDLAKRRTYARAGIATYWIVNLIDQRLEAYSQPSGPTDEPKYGRREEFVMTDSIPVVIAGCEIGCVAGSEILGLGS